MKERVIYLDILKAICCFLVIVLHVSTQNWSNCDVNSFAWDIFNIYDSITRFTVPVLVMISGALFLNGKKQIEIKSLYRKNILRLIISYLFWSTIYAAYLLMFVERGSLKEFVFNVINGYYHMWFIPMIIGLYILVPILRKVAEDVDVMRYFIIVSLFFTFLVPVGLKLPYIAKFKSVYENMELYFPLGYVSYFVLGHYLANKETGHMRKLIMAGGAAGILLTIGISKILSIKNGYATGYYGNDTIPVLLASVAIFEGVKYLCSENQVEGRVRQGINIGSKYSLGIYLLHPLLILILKGLGLNTLTFNPVISVPIISIIVYLLSMALVLLLSKIPKLGKVIV